MILTKYGSRYFWYNLQPECHVWGIPVNYHPFMTKLTPQFHWGTWYISQIVILNTFIFGMWTPTRYTANIHVAVLTHAQIMYRNGNVLSSFPRTRSQMLWDAIHTEIPRKYLYIENMWLQYSMVKIQIWVIFWSRLGQRLVKSSPNVSHRSVHVANLWPRFH